MAIEVSGRIYKIFETKQITERFTKREFVVEIEDGKYPQQVLFQMTGDRCSNLDSFREGQEIKVEFNLRGREWTSPKGEVKYFNSLDVWRLAPLSTGAGVESGDGPPPANEPPGDMDMDIPF
ncbi:MAG: DUF3127 domain-containing protein [Kofleriaceae bacterium]|nr:DUF3127 domain-containing protein [Kofleriaceae bacterium]